MHYRGYRLGGVLPAALLPHDQSRSEASMPDRRTNEDTTIAVEYALFLADTRGLKPGLAHLAESGMKEEILLRALQVASARRQSDRRRAPRK